MKLAFVAFDKEKNVVGADTFVVDSAETAKSKLVKLFTYFKEVEASSFVIFGNQGQSLQTGLESTQEGIDFDINTILKWFK